MAIRKEDALNYHSAFPAGKLSIAPSKPCATQRDLSLAYTPGVAVPCLEIARDPELVYRYTSRGNLVAVVSNGTAVLGLGNIGPEAGKPVMEGKGVLFKRFADIDVFDLELNTLDPDEIIKVCTLLEPTFGGINLEDIKAPECFYIEEELKKVMKIPVFHDDQHGTAIISGAALLNAVELAGKKMDAVRVLINGAGAAGIACAEHYLNLGVKREHMVLCDTKGVIYKGRTAGMNPYKERFASETRARTLGEAFEGVDVFIGLSSANVVAPDRILRMRKNPIIFALANPDPEIAYDLAVAARPDAIVATGRSDYPNQVNNVLGFPFIFRGALDVRASTINREMKLAATYALAALAKQDVPDSVCRAYGVDHLEFGRNYIIPKPFDPRVLTWEATAVARAAMETGVARQPIDLAAYREQLERRQGKAHEFMRGVIQRAQRKPLRVVFPEGAESKILRACQMLIDEKIAIPVLVGDAERIHANIEHLHLDLGNVEIVDPATFERRQEYADELFRLRRRKGVTCSEAPRLLANPTLFGAMTVHQGDAEAMIAGLTQHYPDTIRPALQVIPLRKGMDRVAGLYILITQKGDIYFFADTSVNIDPTAEELADIAIATATFVRYFDVEPRVAMISFSNFGSTPHVLSEKMRRAAEIVRERAPELPVDGEMQAGVAVSPELLEQQYPFSSIKEGANVLVFPNLDAGNAACKLVACLGGATAVGPILVGLSKPVHVLPLDATVEDIVNVTAISVVDAQQNQATRKASVPGISYAANRKG